MLFPGDAMPIPQEPTTRGDVLRRGTLYGAALGLLLGLLGVSVAGVTGQDAVSSWRNWILGGAFVGLLAGAIRAVRMRANRNEDRDV